MADHVPLAIRSLDQWLDAWKTPELTQRATIEWSPRLTRSLGRCYPQRHLIRIASYLEFAEPALLPALLEEVLCHELAHLAAREHHGDRIRPHGPEWKALMRAAGYEPKTRLPLPKSLTKAASPKRSRHDWHYIHRCPVCQRTHVARRSMRRWRCRACVDAGLDGILTITRRKR